MFALPADLRSFLCAIVGLVVGGGLAGEQGLASLEKRRAESKEPHCGSLGGGPI